MTSKPSRVSGVYGLLTLIEVQSAVHNESEFACESLHWMSFWVDGLSCWVPTASLASFLPKANEILGAECRKLSLPGVEVSPGRQNQGAGYGSRGESKVWRPSCRFELRVL